MTNHRNPVLAPLLALVGLALMSGTAAAAEPTAEALLDMFKIGQINFSCNMSFEIVS